MPCRNTFIWAILIASTWKRSTILLRRSLISEKYRQASVCELTTCRLKGVKGNGKSDCERTKHIRMLNARKNKGFVVRGKVQYIKIFIIFIQV